MCACACVGIKKRGHKLLDYDALRAKVKKLTEKPDKDVTKLPRAEKEMEMSKAAYDQLNEQLCSELPQLIDLRVPYLDPSFEALVKIQLRFCAEAYSRMAQVQQYLDADTREQYAQGHHSKDRGCWYGADPSQHLSEGRGGGFVRRRGP